jgi:dTDP-4-dehydrorhamnose 3,5-epimerase
MKKVETGIPDLWVIETQLLGDHRGYFLESFSHEKFSGLGLRTEWIQDNCSLSKKNVLRGLHLQRAPFQQAKLVRVSSGCVWDVAVDCRKNSATLGRWFGLELSEENHKMLLIPEGFAHGFCVLSDDVRFEYKVSAPYAPGHEVGICWDDPTLNITWPIQNPILSSKDQQNIDFIEFTRKF